MDRAAFTQRALEIVKEARPFDASVIDEERFAIVSMAQGGESRLASLGNFWSEYTSASSPRAKEAVFERIARFAALIDSGESLDEIRVLLMPRLRARATFEIDMKGAVEAIRPSATGRKSHVKRAEPRPMPGGWATGSSGVGYRSLTPQLSQNGVIGGRAAGHTGQIGTSHASNIRSGASSRWTGVRQPKSPRWTSDAGDNPGSEAAFRERLARRARNWVLRKHPHVSSYTFVPANRLRRLISQNPMDHRPYLEIWRGAPSIRMG
jgi:hypothetical protein